MLFYKVVVVDQYVRACCGFLSYLILNELVQYLHTGFSICKVSTEGCQLTNAFGVIQWKLILFLSDADKTNKHYKYSVPVPQFLELP